MKSYEHMYFLFFLLASGLRSSAGTTRVTLKEPLLTCARCVPHGKGKQRSCLCHAALGFSLWERKWKRH
jgi:hypothetical protein